MTRTLVKGIKYGTLAQYKALAVKNPDTLYFITDRGVIFRGESIVIPRSVVNATLSGTGASQVAEFTIQTYTAGQTGNNLPQTLTFSVSTQAAVNAVIGTINQSLGVHRIVGGTGTSSDPYVYADGKATDSASGHVTLTDAVDMANPANNAGAASGGAAVTPKGVYDAINSILPGLAGAMQFKGTVASAADMPATYSVGEVYVASAGFTIQDSERTTHVEVGDMLIATTARANATDTPSPNPAHWAIVEQNLTGAVTAQNPLTADALVVGNGAKTAKTLANGNPGKYLRSGTDGKPAWMRHAIHYATCATGESMTHKMAVTYDGGDSLTTLVGGTLVAVRFNEAAHPEKSGNSVSPVLLQVDGTAPRIVIHKSGAYGNYITDYLGYDTILAGDTALFIYDKLCEFTIGEDTYSGAWRLLAVDHLLNRIAFTGNYADLVNAPSNLSAFANDIFAVGTCATPARTSVKEVVLPPSPGFTLTEGAVLMVKFDYNVDTSSSLQITNNDHGVNVNGIIPIVDFVGYANNGILIQGGDTAVFVFSSSSSGNFVWNLVGIHRHIDTAVTAGSTNLITSGAVAAAINNATSMAINKRNFYGVCNTEASTAAKQAIGVTAFELNTGAIVTVKFTNAVTASGATLALSSDLGLSFTDAKYIYYDGQLLATDVIEAGDICTFMYDGAQFNLIAFAREGLKWDSLPEVIV